MENRFRGAGVALITPFNSDFTIDFEALGNIVDYQISGGVDFLVILGTTAETSTLKPKEKQAIISFVAQRVNGRVPLMAGIGGNDTLSIVESIRSFDLSGIDGILSVVPYYNKPTQEGIFRHYMAIAETSPLPLILYNVPARTGISMSAETTLRLANASSKIIATKEASGNFADICRILRDKPQGFSHISGDDALIVPTISLGGEGVISVLGNLLPGTVSELTHTALKGNFTIAAALQLKIQRIIDLLFIEGNPAGVKAAMHIRNLVQNQLRLPLVPVSQTTYDAIAAELMKFEKA